MDSESRIFGPRLYSMTSILARLAGAMAVLSMGGCFFGDRAADRTLEIYQVQDRTSYTGQFQIDASRLPPGAIESRVDSGDQGDPVTSLTIACRYPVRVLLVPATQP
jgi:hypothetical protein